MLYYRNNKLSKNYTIPISSFIFIIKKLCISIYGQTRYIKQIESSQFKKELKVFLIYKAFYTAEEYFCCECYVIFNVIFEI